MFVYFVIFSSFPILYDVTADLIDELTDYLIQR